MMEDQNLLPEGWIDTGTAEQLSGYRAGYIRQLAAEGRIDAQKVGRDWRINKESLMAYRYRDGIRAGRPRKNDD